MAVHSDREEKLRDLIKKKPKNGELTQLERDYNCALSQERIGIEHINRSLKIFKIFAIIAAL